MDVQIHDKSALSLINPDQELEQLATGFLFTEGPAWDFKQNRLIFSDIPANTMYRYSKTTGLEVHRKPSHFSNGLYFDGAGQLLACEHQSRRVSRQKANGEMEILATHYQGKRLNSPNDLIVVSDGSVIFTDPHYGLSGPDEQEQAHRGVYRIMPGVDEPILLADDFEAPNGLALNPDESVIYVDDTIRQHIRSFKVNGDGSLSGGDVFAELKGVDKKGVPDGMKIDVSGNIFCTGAGGIWVFNPTGDLLAHIWIPEVASNLNWGEDDRQSLFITASTSIYQLRCLTSGKPTNTSA